MVRRGRAADGMKWILVGLIASVVVPFLWLNAVSASAPEMGEATRVHATLRLAKVVWEG